MKAIVDRDLCIGCGLCEDTCPEVFRLEDDGIALVIVDTVTEEFYGSVRDSIDLCPVSAISLEE